MFENVKLCEIPCVFNAQINRKVQRYNSLTQYIFREDITVETIPNVINMNGYAKSNFYSDWCHYSNICCMLMIHRFIFPLLLKMLHLLFLCYSNV